MHPNESLLRASLDGELAESIRQDLEAHLQNCAKCRARRAALAQRAVFVNDRLALLRPEGQDAPRSASNVLSTLNQKERQLMQKTPLFRIPRPIWAVITLIAILAIAMSFQPVRALAGNFLGLFRIQQVEVLPVDMADITDIRYDKTVGEAITQLFNENVHVTRESGDPKYAADQAAAEALAGYSVRLSNSSSPSSMLVKPGMAFDFELNVKEAQAVLTELGRGDLQIPPDLGNVTASFDVPNSVTATYGRCQYQEDQEKSSGASLGIQEDCLVFIQAPIPDITVTPEVDLAPLTSLGLQILGKTPEEAAALSSQIDWTTTLVIPVPSGETSVATMQVDGVDGKLIRQLSTEEVVVPGFTLMWVKDGYLYAILASGDPVAAIELANSLK